MKRPRAKPAAAPAAAVTKPQPWGWHLVAVAGLLAANWLLYWPTLHLGFFSLDDPDYVVNNPYLDLTWANVVRLCTVPYFANFSPLHILSYVADVTLAGSKSAFAFHLSNVLWHGFVVCMVYLLAFTLRGHVLTAAGAALLFLVHPAHVEVVAWISSRKDLVAAGFGVLAMTLYLLYRRPGASRNGWYAGSLLCFLLATAGKQSVVLLPAVMLGWDFFVEQRRGWAMVWDKIPFGLVTLLFVLPTLGAQPDTRRAYELTAHAANQLWNFWLLSGLGDHVIYRPTLDTAELNLTGRILVLGAVGSAWMGPLLLHRMLDPVRLMLWFWVLVQLIPPAVFNFITPVTDRYLFLPSVGWCILLADLVFNAAHRPRARPWRAGLVVLGLTVVWAGQTWQYLREWQDPRSVWHAATLKSRACQNHEYLGAVYQEAGDRLHQFLTAGRGTNTLDEARELALAQAVLGDAAHVARLETEWKNQVQTRLHTQAYRDQLWELAWQQFELAVARRGTINTPNLFMRRGMILVNQGKHQAAVAQFEQALRFARTHSYEKVRQENVTHITRALGVAYWQLRHYAEARKWFLEAQQTQQASGQVWIPTLDREVEQISRLAGQSR